MQQLQKTFLFPQCIIQKPRIEPNLIEQFCQKTTRKKHQTHNKLGKNRPSTKEKFHITFKPGVGPLNKKNEMFNNCRHKRRVLLCQKDQDLDQG